MDFLEGFLDRLVKGCRESLRTLGHALHRVAEAIGLTIILVSLGGAALLRSVPLNVEVLVSGEDNLEVKISLETERSCPLEDEQTGD